jgi:hypothetical protein
VSGFPLVGVSVQVDELAFDHLHNICVTSDLAKIADSRKPACV